MREELRRQREEAARDAVYDAVLQLVGEDGAAGLTMERVADLAGLAKGSLYNLFEGKDAVLAYVLDRAEAPFRLRLDELRRAGMGATETLRAMFECLLEGVVRRRDLLVCMRRMLDGEEHIARLFSLAGPLDEVVAQGLALGEFTPLHTGALRQVVRGCLRGVVDSWTFEGVHTPDVPATVNSLMHVFRHGFIRPSADGAA